MLEESTFHHHEIIDDAARLMSQHFQKSIHFSKVIEISEPERRNVILRLQLDNPSTAMPQTLILKKNSIEKQIFECGESETENEQLSRFAHDWAGIEFLTQIGNHHGPLFYAGSLEHKFIIIEDLGLAHPSLVGPLTREYSATNVKDAKSALFAYVRRLGTMHADTAGKSDQFVSILKRIYPEALRFNYIPTADAERIINQLKILTGHESRELTQEIKDILDFSQLTNEFTVFLHGDICPDNVYYQNNIMRFIDFEFGDFGNALVDGVYLRMHMPSCWCSKAVPAEIVTEMEAVYRDALIDDMELIDHEWICPKWSC
jgi:hypothetical protein